jgi:hypothetical protein
MNIGKRFAWVSAYAIAMAFLEAVVVVYIRGLLRITNDHVPGAVRHDGNVARSDHHRDAGLRGLAGGTPPGRPAGLWAVCLRAVGHYC